MIFRLFSRLLDSIKSHSSATDLKEKNQDSEEYSIEYVWSKTGILSRKPNGPVVMLDFDGVTHPRESGTFECLPILEDWLRKNNDVDIIVSSNWKDTTLLVNLMVYFSIDIRHRVIGTTPKIHRGKREDAIYFLIKKYDIDIWVAIDDSYKEFPNSHKEHLVRTDYSTGLTKENLDEVEHLIYLQK